MAVRITKPEINISEKLSELDKPSGVAGESLLRAETPQEAFSLIGAGRKNLVINGSFNISQRGDFTTLTPLSTGEYFVDRFQTVSGSINSSIQQSTSSIGGITCKTLKIHADTSTSSGYMGLRTNLELGGIIVGETYTISCWVKTNRTDVTLRVNDFDVTDQNATQVHGGGDKWEHLTMTVPYTGNSVNPFVRIWFGITYANGSAAISSGDYIQIAMPQLELGSVATPFEHRSYGEELALCQRYYQFIGGSSYQALAQGLHYQAGTATMANIHFLKEMRVAPSISIRGDIIVTNRVSYDDPVTGLAGIASGKSSAFARFNTGITRVNDSPQLVAVANGADGGLQLDAEI
mgnify:CR=1 FL=1